MKKVISIIGIIFLVFYPACREDITLFDDENRLGTIYVDSTPTGADILLDFKSIYKTTPDSIAGLETGNYFVTLRLQGFKDTTVSVTLHPGDKPYVNIKLH